MKKLTHSLAPYLKIGILGAFSLVAKSTALGVEPPPDEAEPPVELENKHEIADENLANTPFIGVTTASLPEMVAYHLNIKHGTGLIVRAVMPESPAEKSGLKPHDIILNAGGLEVNDPDAFSNKIRSMNVGDKLKLKTIQQGKPADIEVTIGERPNNDMAGLMNQAPQLLLDGIPDEQAKQIRDMIKRSLRALDGNELQLLIPENAIGNDFNMRLEMNQVEEEDQVIEPKIKPNIQMRHRSSIRMRDASGSIEMKSNDDNKEVIVRDQNDKIVWSGAWDTEQDKAAAPDEIRKRIESLPPQNGFEFRFRR